MKWSQSYRSKKYNSSLENVREVCISGSQVIEVGGVKIDLLEQYHYHESVCMEPNSGTYIFMRVIIIQYIDLLFQ